MLQSLVHDHMCRCMVCGVYRWVVMTPGQTIGIKPNVSLGECVQPPSELRITVIGDELTAGVGDPKGLGWLGRVSARTPIEATTMMLPLSVPGETTTALSARWQDEFNRRVSPLPHVEQRLVIGRCRTPYPHLHRWASPNCSRTSTSNW